MEAVNHHKVYVDVSTLFDKDGRMMPKYLIWEDGKRYEIDRVTDMRPAPARKAGGYGDWYTIRVNGSERYLFFEHNTAVDDPAPGKWFVERK